jgi:hypothetical protein
MMAGQDHHLYPRTVSSPFHEAEIENKILVCDAKFKKNRKYRYSNASYLNVNQL